MKSWLFTLRHYKKFFERAKARLMSGATTPEAVTVAYRLLLDREPESQAFIDQIVRQAPTLADLRRAILRSAEFKAKNPTTHSPALTGSEPPMHIEGASDQAELDGLLQHVQNVWERFGKVEPHWSVLTSPEYAQANIRQTKEAFYQSGQEDVGVFLKTLERNGLDPADFHTCLDYGCGLGRISRWLAGHFDTVYGVDISQPHLSLAQEYLDEQGIKNIHLQQMNSLQNLTRLPQVDLIFSIIVIQHNPPPIMALILRHLLQALKPGGVAYIQLPTYRQGYRFSPREYLTLQAAFQKATQKMEIHFLPQREVFQIIQQAGCQVLEVLEDDWVGARYGEVSNTFVVRKL